MCQAAKCGAVFNDCESRELNDSEIEKGNVP